MVLSEGGCSARVGWTASKKSFWPSTIEVLNCTFRWSRHDQLQSRQLWEQEMDSGPHKWSKSCTGKLGRLCVLEAVQMVSKRSA